MIEIKENVAYWCPTLESAEKFMELCNKQGISWRAGNKCEKHKSRYSLHKSDSCYTLEDGHFFYGSKGIAYSNINHIPKYYVIKNMEKQKKQTIVIKTDGKTTTAYMGDKQAKAICNDNDEFSLEIGSKLALERLFEEEFKPYLISQLNENKKGNIGEKANFNALFGEELCVGDIVELYMSKTNYNHGKHFVCNNKENGYFIMGVAKEKFNNGVSENGWVI